MTNKDEIENFKTGDAFSNEDVLKALVTQIIKHEEKIKKIGEIDEKIKKQEDKVDKFEGKMEKTTKEIEDKFNDKIENTTKETEEKLNNKIDDSKLKTIETLGIFVALFTFVSIEFQVFRMFDDPQSVAGLTLILLGSLLTFITVLDSVLSKIKLQEDIEFKLLKPKSWPLVFIWMLLMILGGALFVFSPK